MGIKNLTKLIRQFAPNAIRQIDISAYEGKSVAIDANLFVYKFLHGADAHPSRALYGFLDLERWFRKFGIRVVFVFDGRKLEAKRPEIERRWHKRKRLLTRAQECRSELKHIEETPPPVRPRTPPMRSASRVKLELANLEQQIVHVTPQQISDCQHLLRLAGIPVVIAEHEAEATCAALNRMGCVDAVVTEDMDALCFGSPVLLRDCRPHKRTATEIRLKVLLQELKLSPHQFVDLCILCGCDFAAALRSLSYEQAYPAIREYGSIEVLLQHLPPPPDGFSYREARTIFLNPPQIEPKTKEHCFRVEKAKPRGVDDFLRRKVGWQRWRG